MSRNPQTSFSFNRHPHVCRECGAKIVEYKFGLNRGLVAFLSHLGRAGRPVTLDELSLTKSQYTNHALVRHWGLAEQMIPENKLEARKGGKWRLTDEGREFLSGERHVRRYIHTVRNKVVSFSGERVSVDMIDDGYAFRQDYKDQAGDQLKAGA